MADSKASLVRRRTTTGPRSCQDCQPPGSRPSQTPKTAPSRSAARTARPEAKETGPSATVALRSRILAVASSAWETAKKGVQPTATCMSPATAPIVASGRPSVTATAKRSPSVVERNSQPSTVP